MIKLCACGCGEKIAHRWKYYKKNRKTGSWIYLTPSFFHGHNRRTQKKHKIQCLICGKWFIKYGSKNTKLCGQKCWGKYAKKNYGGENSLHWKGGKHEYYKRKWVALKQDTSAHSRFKAKAWLREYLGITKPIKEMIELAEMKARVRRVYYENSSKEVPTNS